MSSNVLARKWRPKVFRDLVGQEHVVQALTHGLSSGRLHHAYLLTGTRGVGKTTIARIIAKALNCQEAPTAEPCGICPACQAIDQGRFPDLIEIDAASRTKVEDTREILDNVQYAPTQGQYKIYLIDEVHMLSTASFNALLKTLEEPPEHVLFILATTDPHKLLPTILSRCLQFALTRLSVKQIENQLHKVLDAEGFTIDERALHQLAKAADGSLRDALSLTDQAIAFCGEPHLSEERIAQMLGLVDQQLFMQLMQGLLAKNIQQTHDVLQQLGNLHTLYKPLLAKVLEGLYWLSHGQIFEQIPDRDNLGPYYDLVMEWKNLVSPEQVQLYYQIGLHTQADMVHAPSERMGFDMGIMRMLAFEPQHHSHPTHSLTSVDNGVPAKTSAQRQGLDALAKLKEDLGRSPPKSQAPARVERPAPTAPTPQNPNPIQPTPSPQQARVTQRPVDHVPLSNANYKDTQSQAKPAQTNPVQTLSPQPLSAQEWAERIAKAHLSPLAHQVLRQSNCTIHQEQQWAIALSPQVALLKTTQIEANIRQAWPDVHLTFTDEYLETHAPQAFEAAQSAQRQAQAEQLAQEDGRIRILTAQGFQIEAIIPRVD